MFLGVTLPIVVFEMLGYACLGLCICHALHQGPLRRTRLIELGIGVLYGLTLETLTIVQLHVYQYGHYLIMLGPVPLSVAVGWGLWVMRAAHPPAREAPLNVLIPMIVLFYFHFFFLSMLFVAGIAERLPALLGISLAMVAVSLVLHGWLAQQKLMMRQSPSQQSTLSSETFGMKEIPPG